MTTAFIAGATGYTGRSVVAACRARGMTTVAHVRPDSSRLAEWRTTFGDHGATVDTSPWTAEGMAAAMARHHPDFVFSLLGTTAKCGKTDGSSYEAVDYGLSVLLLGAAAGVEPWPCFVYLSSTGADGPALNAYMKARVRVEKAITDLGMNHLIARPSFITGEDREEDRPGERVGAKVVDGFLNTLSAVGIKGPRAKYGSITGPQLGEALVKLAVEGTRGTVEAAALQAAAG